MSEPNKILVENPRVFDDSTLQQQLELNSARLSALSGLDQSSLISHLGNVSGANQSFSSSSFNVQGPQVAQQVTTAAIPNTQTVQTNLVSNGTTASNAVSVPISNSQTQTQTTSNPATQQTVTTQPSFAPPPATPAAAPNAVTSGFSVQSSAILAEQVQLASSLETELLEQQGALSDRLTIFTDGAGVSNTAARTRATIGFNVSLAPTDDEKDAAAVVEVIVANCQQLGPEAPAVTALLPSEKNFNVAAIRNKSTGLGAGIATQLIGVSGGFLFGHNSYFLVQDQDTIAQIFNPSADDQTEFCRPNECVGIRWIFRPVLGKRFVGGDRRKLALQLAFPETGSDATLGQATIRTYWRHFDRKTGLVGDQIGNATPLYSYPIHRYKAEDVKPSLNAQSFEDLGNGQVLVKLDGTFFPGSYIRVGNSLLLDASSGLVRGTAGLRFIASASDVLVKKSFLVAKSGDDSQLIINWPQFWPRQDATHKAVAITTLDSTFSRVEVSYCEASSNLGSSGYDPLQPLLLIGGRAYGLLDAPLDRQTIVGAKCEVTDPTNANTDLNAATVKKLGLTIPTATLLSSPDITLSPLFADRNHSFPLHLIQGSEISPLSQTDRLVILKQTKDSAEFLLYGSRLNVVSQVDPAVSLDKLGGAVANDSVTDSLRSVTLTVDQIKQYKFLVITRGTEAPEAIAIPTVTFPDSPGPVVTGTVLKDDDTAVVSGSGLGDLKIVKFKDVEIPFTVAKDGKSATLTHLRKAGVTSNARLQLLEFYFKPVQVKVDVFTQKEQTVPR